MHLKVKEDNGTENRGPVKRDLQVVEVRLRPF